jgi:hypothetical protein
MRRSRTLHESDLIVGCIALGWALAVLAFLQPFFEVSP